MNVEELRDYCLSLGADVEERMPFGAFRAAQGVLAFYVCSHMFCFFDIDAFKVVTVKCQPERISMLREAHEGIVAPYNMSPKHWIGIRPNVADNSLMRELVRNSYEIIKNQYRRRKKDFVAPTCNKAPKS